MTTATPPNRHLGLAEQSPDEKNEQFAGDTE
jgi:hypothetical protein